MTALLAAGGGLPLALHIPHVVEQVGSIAGFAAIIGLAVLSALYFSQARDLRRLREWAGRAPERAAEIAATGRPGVAPVPGRVMPVPQRSPQAVQPPSTTAGAGAQAAAQPAGTNGSPAPEVTKVADDQTKVGAGEEAAVAAAEAQAPDGDGAAQPNGDEAAKAPGAPDEKPDGAPAKPAGMPAPASAAAAAGAAVAGATGSAAPAAPAAVPGQAGAAAPPGAPPQRPPGSVLPPRTGALPPVRRLPTGNVGRPGVPATSAFGAPPPDEKPKRNPLYVVLAVAGVLILGAGAAIGVPKLVNGAKNNNSSTKTAAKAKKKTTRVPKAAPVRPDKITVAVLNGTGIPGLAAQIGDRVDADGFTLGTVSNASQAGGQRANSVAMYAAGHQRDAQVVARKLRIRTVTQVDAASRSIAGNASVVVVVGSDKTQ